MENIKFRIPLQNTVWTFEKDKCKLPNGMVINDYYVNEYSDWVNAFVITTENKVVLVEQYRYTGGDFFLEIPAGKIEESESYEEGILRELREETGFTSRKKNKLLTIEAVSCYPDYRERGISKALLLNELNVAKELGAEIATVYTAMPEKYPAPNTRG